MPPAWHQAVAAYRRRDEAQRTSMPPREADPPAGLECMRLLISGPGWAHDVRCTVPADRGRNRPRSDQYAVTIDGQQWQARAGLTALLRHLQSEVIPRAMTRRQRALEDQIRCMHWAEEPEAGYAAA